MADERQQSPLPTTTNEQLRIKLHQAALRARRSALQLQQSTSELEELCDKLSSAQADVDNAATEAIVDAWHSIIATINNYSQISRAITRSQSSDNRSWRHIDRRTKRIHMMRLQTNQAAQVLAPSTKRKLSTDTGLSVSLKRPAVDDDAGESEARRLKKRSTRSMSPFNHSLDQADRADARASEVIDPSTGEMPPSSRSSSVHSDATLRGYRSDSQTSDVERDSLPSPTFSLDDVEMFDSGAETVHSEIISNEVVETKLFDESCKVSFTRHPGVHYMDVTAEVEERSRLKELRRLATKGDMKRKQLAQDVLNPKLLAVEQAQERAQEPALKRHKQGSSSDDDQAPRSAGKLPASKRSAGPFDEGGGRHKKHKV